MTVKCCLRASCWVVSGQPGQRDDQASPCWLGHKKCILDKAQLQHHWLTVWYTHPHTLNPPTCSWPSTRWKHVEHASLSAASFTASCSATASSSLRLVSCCTWGQAGAGGWGQGGGQGWAWGCTCQRARCKGLACGCSIIKAGCSSAWSSLHGQCTAGSSQLHVIHRQYQAAAARPPTVAACCSLSRACALLLALSVPSRCSLHACSSCWHTSRAFCTSWLLARAAVSSSWSLSSAARCFSRRCMASAWAWGAGGAGRSTQ